MNKGFVGLAIFAILTAGLTIGVMAWRLRQRDINLARERERIRLMAENISGMSTFLVDLQGRVSSWNEGARRLKGYDTDEIVGKPFSIFCTPEDIQAGLPQALLDAALRDGVCEIQGWRVRKDGSRLWADVILSSLKEEHGAVVGFVEVTRDTTQRMKTEAALLLKENQFRTAIETTNEGYWMVDLQGHLLEVNAAYCRMSGYTRENLLTMQITQLIEWGGPDQVKAKLDAVAGAGTLTFEASHRACDGRVWPTEMVATYSELGGRVFVFIRDVTVQKQAAALAWRQANFDSLTGLPNRALLFEHLSKDLSMSRRNNHSVALLFADLDGFKKVNDQHGHEGGDVVLKTIAKRWLACSRATDTVARLGGDEFAIVVQGRNLKTDAALIAQKIVDAANLPIVLPSGETCRVGGSSAR